MMVDTRIYGYIGDGFALCPPCADAAYGRQVEDELSGVYSHEDDGNGLTCDDCHGVIFETYCGECDKFGHSALAWGDDCDEFAEDED